jgi:hypothetical protein
VATIAIATLILVVTCLAVACSKAPEERAAANAPPGSTGTRPAPAPATPAPAAARSARDVCALLPAAEVTELTSIPIERAEKTADGCKWYATAAAQREKGTATVTGTLEKMTRQEPATAEEGARNVEAVMKGLIGAVGAGGPFLVAAVQSENADQAEATLKGTVAVVGAGLPGGKLEAVEGLGDRAYLGPGGSFLYVRKGPALVTLDLRQFFGTREQAIALAKRLLSRI